MFVTGRPDRGGIDDFDVVVCDGRPLLVTDYGATWDPVTDTWTDHQLDELAWGGFEIDGVAAAVVAGRIVIGGGGGHQAFAQWDLATGRVISQDRPHHGCVGNVSRAVLGGREYFVIGGTGDSAYLWAPGEPDPVVELWDEFCEARRIAAGTVWNRPVLFGPGESGWLWDVERRCPMEGLDDPPDLDEVVDFFAIANTLDHVRLVAASREALAAFAPEAGGWGVPLAVPGGVTCLEVGNANGLPVAVTGAEDGTVCVYDLLHRRPLRTPLVQHANEVTAVQVSAMDGRAVVFSADRGGGVRVEALDRV